ncbi:MAG: prepilin-type cleavage/methylation domain-containing protein [Verrucomicrobia bacterium]|nr:MAG: prepilin-type cleavage/methylation domain-containing protein [Verrucomicrobiota bacterium]
MPGKTHSRPTRRAGFTLVEIMIVVGIITLLAALAIPGFLRARKRAQASRVKDDLRLIEAAVDQYAVETQRQPGAVVSVADWTAYLKKETLLCTTGKDLLGHDFGSQTVDQIPIIPSATYAALSDVADDGFWAPFGP